ncbi:MAG: RpiB/LacA/LacB family sugar-phosphate isomerase [Actinomycetota bacterium]|nr:RpiB/LacA/LacB family sugar-phosphate isomerase [Actinomycetota bacterium]
MRIAIGTDEEDSLVPVITEELVRQGHDVVVLARGEEWPEVGSAVGRAVAEGVVDAGVVCCWTGTGVAIAANKVRGVRAALCADAEIARGARLWNDANVLALGVRLTSPTVAKEILVQFFATQPDPDEAARIARVSEIESADGEHVDRALG